MPKALKDFISASALVGALFSFFVFASNKWISNVEADVATLKESALRGDKAIVEITATSRDVLHRLERIEHKLDQIRNR